MRMRTHIGLVLTVLLWVSVGAKAQQDVYSWRIGVKGGIATNSNAITYPQSLRSYFYGIQVQPRLSPSFSMRLDLNKSFFNSRTLQHDSRMLLAVVYTFDNDLIISERATVAPYIALGGGYANYSAKYVELSIKNSDWVAAGEVGVKFRVSDRININLFSSLQYALNNANFSSFGGGGLTQQFGVSTHINFRLRKSDFKAPSYFVGKEHEVFNPVPDQRSILTVQPDTLLVAAAGVNDPSTDSTRIAAVDSLDGTLQEAQADTIAPSTVDSSRFEASIRIGDGDARFTDGSDEPTMADRLQLGAARSISDPLRVDQSNRAVTDTARPQVQQPIPAQPTPSTVVVVQSPAQQAPVSQPVTPAPDERPSDTTQPSQSTPSNINIDLQYPPQQPRTVAPVVGVPIPVSTAKSAPQTSTLQDSVMLEMLKTLRVMQSQLTGSTGNQPLTNADATNQQLVRELVKAQAESNQILKDRIKQLEGQPNHPTPAPTPVNVIVNQKETKVIEKPEVAPASPTAIPSGSKFMDVYFPVNQWSISADQRDILAYLAKTVNQDTSTILIISGFADNLGEDGYNVKISKFRAEAVYNYLKSRGVSEQRLKLQYHGKKFATGPSNMDDRKVEIEIMTRP